MREIRVKRGALGCELGCAPELHDGPVELSLRAVRRAEIRMHARIVRSERRRAFEGGDRLAHLAEQEQRRAEIGEAFRTRRIELGDAA